MLISDILCGVPQARLSSRPPHRGPPSGNCQLRSAYHDASELWYQFESWLCVFLLVTRARWPFLPLFLELVLVSGIENVRVLFYPLLIAA